jgi:hypothetical protein
MIGEHQPFVTGPNVPYNWDPFREQKTEKYRQEKKKKNLPPPEMKSSTWFKNIFGAIDRQQLSRMCPGEFETPYVSDGVIRNLADLTCRSVKRIPVLGSVYFYTLFAMSTVYGNIQGRSGVYEESFTEATWAAASTKEYQVGSASNTLIDTWGATPMEFSDGFLMPHNRLKMQFIGPNAARGGTWYRGSRSLAQWRNSIPFETLITLSDDDGLVTDEEYYLHNNIQKYGLIDQLTNQSQGAVLNSCRNERVDYFIVIKPFQSFTDQTSYMDYIVKLTFSSNLYVIPEGTNIFLDKLLNSKKKPTALGGDVVARVPEIGMAGSHHTMIIKPKEVFKALALKTPDAILKLLNTWAPRIQKAIGVVNTVLPAIMPMVLAPKPLELDPQTKTYYVRKIDRFIDIMFQDDPAGLFTVQLDAYKQAGIDLIDAQPPDSDTSSEHDEEDKQQ